MDRFGTWAFFAFLVGAGAASFSSATGTLFGAGYMVPQAFGYETTFCDDRFRAVVHGLIALSVVLAVAVLTTTDLSPVELAIVMPAVNGVIGLPFTVLALYGAVDRYFDLSRVEHAVFAVTTLVTFVTAAVSFPSLVALLRLRA